MTRADEAEISATGISPHFRERIAFIAALIQDLEHANWPVISDTLENLSQETKGTPLEKSIERLRDPARRRHTHALAQTIDALLRDQ